MKSSTKRALSLLATAILLIAALVVYAAMIRPAYGEIVELRGALFARRALFAEQEAAINKVLSLIEQYQGAGRLQDVVSLSLPETEALSGVFGQLNAMAKANNIGIEVFGVQRLPIRPSGNDLIRGLGTLRLSVRAVGSYESFKGFLNNIETNIRVMDMAGFKIEPAGLSTQNVFIHNLTIDTYYQS
jgi:Tfp pilus assembly protein PilO